MNQHDPLSVSYAVMPGQIYHVWYIERNDGCSEIFANHLDLVLTKKVSCYPKERKV